MNTIRSLETMLAEEYSRLTSAVFDQFATAGIDVYALAATLQDEGAKSFVNSWNELMGVIASKSASLQKAS